MFILSSFLFLFPQAPMPQGPPFLPAHVVGEAPQNLYSFFDSHSPVVTQLPPGTPVRIVAERTPWARVQVPAGLVVWVYGTYVDTLDHIGTLNATHVRARPLPSTGSESHPVGQFEKGDVVTVLESEGDWLQVLAPETLGAWIPLSALEKTPTLSAKEDQLAWEKVWTEVAKMRRAVWVPPVPEGAKKTEITQEEDVAGLLILEEPEETENFVFPSEDEIFGDSLAALELAETRTKSHADAVVKELHSYETETVENLERIYSTLLLHDANTQILLRSRQGLDKLDALQRFREAALLARGRRAELHGETVLAEATARALAPMPLTGTNSLEKHIWVGWMEYRPHLHSRAPFVVTRGSRAITTRSYDGRYFLKDVVGKEVVIEGIWRKDADVPGERILAVTQLRVLPRRFEK